MTVDAIENILLPFFSGCGLTVTDANSLSVYRSPPGHGQTRKRPTNQYGAQFIPSLDGAIYPGNKDTSDTGSDWTEVSQPTVDNYSQKSQHSEWLSHYRVAAPKKQQKPIPQPKANLESADGMCAKQYFECSYCEVKFTTKTSCRRHVKRHIGQYRSFCDICNKGFMNKLDYEGHMNVHMSRRPYECEVCKKTFPYKRSYMCHKQTHQH